MLFAYLLLKNKKCSWTLRSCGPNRSALPPRPRRCQGAGLAGRQHQGRLAVCRVCQHQGWLAAQHQGWLAAQHQGWLAVCVPCVPLWPYGTHGTHFAPVWVMWVMWVMLFYLEVARQTWIPTLFILLLYTVYIFSKDLYI